MKPHAVTGAITPFERFAVVRVPFPFSDRQASKRRPALVLSDSAFQQQSGHLLLAMVTSARQSAWPMDWRRGLVVSSAANGGAEAKQGNRPTGLPPGSNPKACRISPAALRVAQFSMSPPPAMAGGEGRPTRLRN